MCATRAALLSLSLSLSLSLTHSSLSLSVSLCLSLCLSVCLAPSPRSLQLVVYDALKQLLGISGGH